MATTTTSYSGNRPPPGALHAEFTLVDVSSAISKQLDLSSGSNEVAGLAGKLHSFVNGDPAFRTSGLDGANFRSLVISNLTPEIARALDPSQAAALRKEQQQASVGKPDNPFALGSGHRSMVNGVLVSEGGKGEAGYGSLPGSLTATQKAALDVVNKYPELGWVKGNTQLLNLGPAAMDILAQTHLRKETFNSLKDAGFSTKGSVGIASMLHDRGSKDVNKDAQTLADNVKSLNDPAFKAAIDARAKLQVPAPDETPAQAEARKAQIPAAEDQVRAAAAAHVAKKPQDAAKVEDVTNRLGIAAQKNAVTQRNEAGQDKATADKTAKADAKDAKADAKDAEADALLAGLSDPKPASSASKGQEPPAKHDQGKPKVPKPSGKPPAGPRR